MALRGLFGARKAGNYAYVTARVRAKRSFLLPRDTYPKLLVRDVHEIARTLQEGQYKDEVDELAGRHRGAELIERATRLNLGRTYSQILSWSQGELRAMVELYLGRYDVYNVKTILRGKFARVDADRILASLVPAGGLPWTRLERLARLETLDEVVAALADTPYGAAVADAVGSRRQLESLFAVENALDRAYYKLLLASVVTNTRPKQAFRQYLQREVDITNLKTVFRLKAEDLSDLEPYWLEGGLGFTYEEAQRVLRGRMDEIAATIGDLPWWKDVEPAIVRFFETRELNPLVTAIDASHVRSADHFSRTYPLSVLPVVSYILRKKVEVDNLRILASGKETGLSESVLEGLIVA